jgi:phasin family protein
MFAINEQFSKFSSNGFENLLRAAQISLDSSERLIKYQFELSKQVLEDNVQIAQELAGLKDVQQVFGHINKVLGQSVEKAMQNSREVYDILAQTRSELTDLTESSLERLNQSVAGTFDTFTQNGPAGSEAALNAMRDSMTALTATLSGFSQAVRQVTEISDNNVKAATQQSAPAKSSSRRASQAQA